MKLARTLASLLLLALAPAFAQQDLAPEALVKKVTSDVLETIKNDPQLAAGDRRKALALAEQKVLPHVDFVRATQLAVGRAWKGASPEQQDKLVSEFRSMLIRIYSNAINAYRGQTMRVQPVKMAPDATDVTVRNQYVSPGRQPVLVEYAMHKTPEGWKIYDIVVENISLVLTFRAEFEQVVRQSGVEGLIKRMAEKNAPPKQSAG
jgi:phospholipid transport system substrate-binding protein